MRKLLLQLDTSPHPSVFDRVVALDGGADEVMSYGGVTENAVRDLVHGAIFTRGPKDLRNTAVFIGGTDMAAGERLLAAVQAAFFGPLRVSVMLDSNGSNTTAVAAVAKLQQAAGDPRGCRVVITAGTGPVGARAAGLLARAGAEVTITSRRPAGGTEAAGRIRERFGSAVREVTLADSAHAAAALEGAELLLNAGPPGVRLGAADRLDGPRRVARGRGRQCRPAARRGRDRGERRRRAAGRCHRVRRPGRGEPEDEDPQSLHRPPVRTQQSRARRGDDRRGRPRDLNRRLGG